MSTTSTDYNWYWYIRKKGRKRYLGLVDQNGDAPTAAYDIEIWYDEIPDEFTSDDSDMAVPQQYELPIIKAVASEIMVGDSEKKQIRREFMGEYENCIYNAIHDQIQESQQPMIVKPIDLRDDEPYGTETD